ncbi:MAG TPA: nucleotide sugar dehydrogenase [Candidatus Paceibacterota bacterium]|nr:nucleotide sugar dehydrogenase [Candidatus Paceibacterota bacterium]
MNASKKRKILPPSGGTVAVVGLGYVGLPLALLAERKGYRVIGIDIAKERIRLLSARIMPFQEDGLVPFLKKSKMEATDNFAKIREADIIIICVPTPVHEDHTPDFTPVKEATKRVAEFLRKEQVVILESTVSPGSSENIVIPLLEKISGLRAGQDFSFAHCPERINPGDPQWNIEYIPRVVGGVDERSTEQAVGFYRSILQGPVTQMGSVKEAEAVKIVENSFRDINIAFVNELAMSFATMGIDVTNVLQGASTKPFAFMAHDPGCGVGGHCIPVDPYYLIDTAKQNGFLHRFLSLARSINAGMPKYAADLLTEGLRERNIPVKGTKTALLGLAYKPDIDDDRESPSYEIEKCLKQQGLRVATFDPFVLQRSSAASLEKALKGARAVVVATAHTAFCNLEPEFLHSRGVQVVVDGRNCLSKEAFLQSEVLYKGIGR